MKRGEIWQTKFDPALQSEGSGERSAIIISIDQLNDSKMPLVTTILLTTSQPRVEGRLNIRIEPSHENGLTKTSWAQPHITRSMNKQRLLFLRGRLGTDDLTRVEQALRSVLGL